MTEVLPDGGQAVKHTTDQDTRSQQNQQQNEIPAGEDRKELQPVKDWRKRAKPGQLVHLNPGGIGRRVANHLSRGLLKIDTKQTYNANSYN